LTRPLEKHLDDAEIDAIVSSPDRVADSGPDSELILSDAERHAESCEACNRKVQMHKHAQGELHGLSSSEPVQPGQGCPQEEEDWLHVAAGLLPEEKAKELMNHAAQCDHCGPLLRKAAGIVADEATPAEESTLANLASAQPNWQRDLAEKLRGNVQGRPLVEQRGPWWERLFSWPRPAFAAAALAAIVAVGWLGPRMLRHPSAEQLLAQAYTDHRTLEVRIPRAKYAPLRVERSSGGSNFDKSPSLLRAEALISDNLTKNPNDPTWLQFRARADLLDGNYDSAIKALQRALDTQPDSPQLLADLGSAYYLRAESTDRPIDYGNAIEAFGKALVKSPDDPIALYNRALACERMFLYSQAVDDWEHYLRLDPQGGWADEARRKLGAVKEKLKVHADTMAEPLVTPAEIAKHPDDQAVRDKMDGRIEEYLHIAITKWLPEAFPAPATSNASIEAKSALPVLAALLAERHGDTWLADLLRDPTGAQFPFGLQALSASVAADDSGDYSGANKLSHQAVQLLRAAGNPAGELRAQAEEVYSDHLLWEGKRCIVLLRSLDETLKRSSYGWLRGQMSLEMSNCASIVGDLGTYETAIIAGIREAQIHKYTALYLRGLGFQALSAASIGDTNKAFSLAAKGLTVFWSEQVDVTKGYNFYTHLDAAANELRLPNFQVALWEEATTLLDHDANVLRLAMAHRWYGNAAYLANMPAIAASEFSKASELFAASPRTPATARDHMDAEVWTANAEIRQGDLDGAAARLQGIKRTLDGATAFDPEIGFYSAQADIAMRRSDSAASESMLRSAIFLSEWALNSFPSGSDRRQWAEETRTSYRDAVEWKLRQGDATSALELWEWYRGAELRAGDRASFHANGSLDIEVPPDPQNAPPLPSPTVVANALPLLRDETVVAYATFPDGIAIWVYDDRGILSRWVSTPSVHVEELVLRFRRLCSDSSSDISAVRATARSLYDLLIAPVEGRFLVGRTVMVEPIDFLNAVPWEALVDREGHYFTERAAVMVMPGLYREMRLRPSSAVTSETPVLIVSVPVAAEDGLTPLADAENEARQVSQSFSSARWLEGANATLTAIRRELRGKAVFHFAGHAVASPQRSGLVLAELDPNTRRPRLFAADDVVPTETSSLVLAILSACDTGIEAQAGDSATETLVQALLHSGVPHVVASRWNVDSSETAKFMQQFYIQLLSGHSVANSMRSAQLALVSRPSSAHPYYWSAFELEGKR
jgi:CHAT domain-containing protein/tetratricopeptide (TPR) repeat protein